MAAPPLSLSALLLVGAGGFAGAVLRYLAGYWLPPVAGFPLALLAVNVLGSLALGFVLGLALKGSLGPAWVLLLGTGLCGGFTTYSTFSYEWYALLVARAWGQAALLAGTTLVLGLLATALGLWLSRALG